MSISNFVESLSDYAKSGFKDVPTELRQARIDVCRTCSYSQYGILCGACDCIISVKSRWGTEDCPICSKCGKKEKDHDGECDFLSKWGQRIELGIIKKAPEGAEVRKCCGQN